jgi:hypothetical protein
MLNLLLHRPRRNEHGALTPAVIVMAIGLLLLGGLVTDGGRQLNAKLRAQATAEEAARAGANMLDLREPEAVIDTDKATEAIERYCDLAMQQDDTITACEVTDFGHDDNKETDFVEVHVEMSISPLLFGLIGIQDLKANATATASAVQAVTDPYHDRAFPELSPSPDIPTTTIDIPTNTDDPTSVIINPPTGYTTHVCGTPFTLPLDQGVSCSQTTVTLPTDPPPPPTLTTVETSFTTYPTTVTPDF